MQKRTDTIIRIRAAGRLYPFGRGIASAEETAVPELVQVSRLNSTVVAQEVVGYRCSLDFEGVRLPGDETGDYLASLYQKRGEDIRAELILYDAREKAEDGRYRARIQPVNICIYNPGSGKSLLGSRLRGSFLYRGEGTRGWFDPESGEFTYE